MPRGGGSISHAPHTDPVPCDASGVRWCLKKIGTEAVVLHYGIDSALVDLGSPTL
ncbi:unnamed protein product [Penicillium roqueforti FM164]|uniref:Genomic scaffold, ProqFM164S01 n=1 Tax=Penicillium roqueforti (strain FM164) TaxID=1365484 RepID=W6PXB7_PENRF|nr:unnamed protein product [Penicillium roqueforti FM164]